MHLDDIDKKLINLVQRLFPLNREPYSDLGAALGTDGADVLRRVDRLKAGGIIRHIGPVLDPASLGYQTTLMAARMAEDNLEAAAKVVSQHPGVSHCYQRDHEFNLWFTLALPQGIEIQGQLQQLKDLTGAEVILDLPAIKVFKIKAFFDVAGEGVPAGSANNSGVSDGKAKTLSDAERRLVNVIQQDLPLVQRPFDPMSEAVALDVDEFLSQCQSLLRRGIMRRFGASIKHNSVGFVANAMTCWQTAPDLVEAAGRKLASCQEVSHCYERRTGPSWPYNLFAMIHGHAPEDCQAVADQVSQEMRLNDYVQLFSTKEFKKERITYPV